MRHAAKTVMASSSHGRAIINACDCTLGRDAPLCSLSPRELGASAGFWVIKLPVCCGHLTSKINKSKATTKGTMEAGHIKDTCSPRY